MSESSEPSLAALPVASPSEHDAELVREMFRRDGRLAGMLWKAYRSSFDEVDPHDGNFPAILKSWEVRYSAFLKEGA